LGCDQLAKPTALIETDIRDLEHYSGLGLANEYAAAKVAKSSLHFKNGFRAELAAATANR
jgi:hypothetical protein